MLPSYASRQATQIGETKMAEIISLRAQMLEDLAMVDDSFAELFLESTDGGLGIAHIHIHAAIRRATLAFKAVPLYCGAARRNKGVQPLLDAVIAYLPSLPPLSQVLQPLFQVLQPLYPSITNPSPMHSNPLSKVLHSFFKHSNPTPLTQVL